MGQIHNKKQEKDNLKHEGKKYIEQQIGTSIKTTQVGECLETLKNRHNNYQENREMNGTRDWHNRLYKEKYRHELVGKRNGGRPRSCYTDEVDEAMR